MVLCHVVALKFKADLTDEQIIEHFKTEVNLKERMPDLVIEWNYGKNVSLLTRPDVNKGCNWVVMVKLADEAALEAYLPHPEHVKVKELQGPLVEDIFVCDLHV